MKKALKITSALAVMCGAIAIMIIAFRENKDTTVVTEPYNVCNDLNGAVVDCSQSGALVVQQCNASGCVEFSNVDDVVSTVPTAAITGGSVSVEFPAQPTVLAGNYTDNGIMLRAWAEKNKQSIAVPAEAKNIRIGFTFAKVSKYDAIPGNLQLSVDGKNLCNGRLTSDKATVDLDTDTYRYSFNNVSTQDKPKGVDLSSAVGKTLGIKVWIGENKNYVESVQILYDL